MNRQEFFEWLNTCPSHDWDIVTDETGCTRIVFMYEEEEE